MLGALSAYRLAQAGAEVRLVEAGDLCGGASGASFAHVNASYSGYWDYVELRQSGVTGYETLRAEPGGAPWWHRTGYLSVQRSGGDFDAFDRHLERLRERGYLAQRVDGRPSAVEPALAGIDAARATLFPDEGYVDLPGMVADLVARARGLGVTVRTNDAVAGVLTSGRDVTGLELQSGELIECDQVLVCAGRWTDRILALAGLETRFVAQDFAAGTPVPGLLVLAEAVPGCPGRVVSVDDVNYRPEPAGRTMVWSGLIDAELVGSGGADADPADVRRLADELLGRASQHVPALAGTTVHEALPTMRAMPVDGLPIVGRPAGVDGLYVTLAHAAATLAPSLADAVTAELVHEQPDPRLERFRPDRLTENPAVAPQKEGIDDLAETR